MNSGGLELTVKANNTQKTSFSTKLICFNSTEKGSIINSNSPATTTYKILNHSIE